MKPEYVAVLALVVAVVILVLGVGLITDALSPPEQCVIETSGRQVCE